MSDCDVIKAPIKFLGATILSVNSTLGLGSTESTLKVDLVEDCEDNDSFMPKNGSVIVGAPVYLKAGDFAFGGILQGWTANQGSSGYTFSVDIADPRSILSNTVVIIDSYIGPPAQAINYFNVYNYIEGQVLQGNCAVFGNSRSNDRGMPYSNIVLALQQMNPTIYSSTGYQFIINFNSFPQNLPLYYKIPGPSVTLLELLEQVCEVLGYEFYVDLLPGGIINIGLIDLKIRPSSFASIITAYNATATDLSYGQELRNETTKTVIFGEKQHYLSRITQFNHFFGEDFINNQYVPVIPWGVDKEGCGFWISKDITSLNSVLNIPLPNNGPYDIHELDIRCAMSTMEIWMFRTFSKEFENMNGTFNKAIQDHFPPEIKHSLAEAAREFKDSVDKALNPSLARVRANRPDIFTELEAIYNWIKNLGNTYYGKQFIAPLNQLICYYQLDNNPLAEKFFSDIPTNDGGWVDNGVPVLGLTDPELGLFKTEDNRIQTFAIFNNEGYDTNEPDVIKGDNKELTEGPYIGDINIDQEYLQA